MILEVFSNLWLYGSLEAVNQPETTQNSLLV